MNPFLKMSNVLLAILCAGIYLYGFIQIQEAEQCRQESGRLINLVNQRISELEKKHIFIIKPELQKVGFGPEIPSVFPIATHINIHKSNPEFNPAAELPPGHRVVLYWPLNYYHNKSNTDYRSKGVLRDSTHLNLLTEILHTAKEGKKLRDGIGDAQEVFLLISINDIFPTSSPPPDFDLTKKVKINNADENVILEFESDDGTKYLLISYKSTSESENVNSIVIEDKNGPHQEMKFKNSDLKTRVYLVKPK